MPLDGGDLGRRIAAMSPKDTVRGLMFNGVLAVVREVLGEGQPWGFVRKSTRALMSVGGRLL